MTGDQVQSYQENNAYEIEIIESSGIVSNEEASTSSATRQSKKRQQTNDVSSQANKRKCVMDNFVLKFTEKDIEKHHMSFLKAFVVNDLDPEILTEKNFCHFIENLTHGAYSLPKIAEINSRLIPKLHQTEVSRHQSRKCIPGTLFVICTELLRDESASFACFVKTEESKSIFVDSISVDLNSGSSSQLIANESLNHLIGLCSSLYNIRVTAVCCNQSVFYDKFSSVAENKDLIILKSMSSSIRSSFFKSSENEVDAKVQNIVNFFTDDINLRAELSMEAGEMLAASDFDSLEDKIIAMKLFINNQNVMKGLCGKNSGNVPEEIDRAVYSNDFKLSVERRINELRKVSTLLQFVELKDASLAACVDLFFENDMKTIFTKDECDAIVTKNELFSYMLHPKFKAHRFSVKDKMDLKLKLVTLLKKQSRPENFKNEMEALNEFLKGEDIFGTTEQMDLANDPTAFWSIVEDFCPTLAKLAKVTSALPASTIEAEQIWANNKILNSDRYSDNDGLHKRFRQCYYSLKID